MTIALSGRIRPRPPRRSSVDIATVAGLFTAFALLLAAIAIGGSFVAFMNVPSLLIVLGGTFAVTAMCFSLTEVTRAQTIAWKAIVHHAADPGAAAEMVVRLADHARREGVLGLQNRLPALRADAFLYKALMMVVDGTHADAVERVLANDINAMQNRHLQSANVLRKAADVAPAMGLIGTLVGLVQMLTNLDDPSNIGPAMAVALLTTFYGAVLSNMVFSPLAAKLERNSDQEALLHNLYAMAAVSISKQENPRRLEMLLNTVLPPAKRLRFFD